MNKLLILTDLGLFKAFRVDMTPEKIPRLQPLREIVLAEAHRRFDQTVTDMAGRHVSPTHRSWGTPLTDDHNLRLENKHRLIKRIAKEIGELVQRNGHDGVWLAAHKEINHQILGELPRNVREQIEKNLRCDLTKAPEKELLDHF